MPPLRGYVEDVAQVNLAKLPPPPEPPVPFYEERPREILKQVASYAVDVPNPEYKRLYAAKEQQIKAIANLRVEISKQEQKIKQISESMSVNGLHFVIAGISGGIIGNDVAPDKNKGTGMVVGGLAGILGVWAYKWMMAEDFKKQKAETLQKETHTLKQWREKVIEWEKVLALINSAFSNQSELLTEGRTKISNAKEIAEQEQKIKEYEQKKDQAYQESIAYSKAVAEYETKYGSIQAAYNALEDAEEMPQAEVNDSGVISSLGLNKVVGGALLFKGAWRNFFGTPSRGFKLVIHGPSFSGKSHLALKFAYYLAVHHGKVLYNTSEEGFSRTMDSKLEKLGARAQGLDIGNYSTVADLKKKIPRTTYNFIILDSVSDMNMDAEALQELRRFYCCSAVIGICQNTKAGDIRGGYDLVH
ncbi:MAG: ATP-binding protein, partial [Bacteroidia bacterium]